MGAIQQVFFMYKTTGDVTAPTVPSSITESHRTTTSYRVNWGASTDADSGMDSYELFRDGTLFETIAFPTLLFNVTGEAAGTNKLYKVRAKDVAGNVSAFTAEVQMGTLCIAPTLVFVEMGEITILNHSWDSVTGDASYNLYWLPQGGTVTAIIGAVSSNYTNVLTPGYTYDFYVVAINAQGFASADSNIVSTFVD